MWAIIPPQDFPLLIIIFLLDHVLHPLLQNFFPTPYKYLTYCKTTFLIAHLHLHLLTVLFTKKTVWREFLETSIFTPLFLALEYNWNDSEDWALSPQNANSFCQYSSFLQKCPSLANCSASVPDFQWRVKLSLTLRVDRNANDLFEKKKHLIC